MSELAEMRKQLKEMRKEAVKPVSRMRKADISVEIERMKKLREQTPAPASVPSAASKKVKPVVESVKKAKAAEFPVAPVKEEKKKAPAKKAEKAMKEEAPKKKASRIERAMAMMDEMSDTDEE
jgi:hypothetical protein